MTKRERNMLVVLAVIATGAAAFLLLGVLGGGEEEQQAAPTSPISSPPPVPASPGTGVGEPTEEPPRAVTFFGGRDPFVPLVVVPTTSPGASLSPGATVSPGGSPAPAISPSPGGVTDGDGIGVTGRPVVLVDVLDESTVQVEVEGEPLTVTEGERFAGSYEFLSVDANCARFLYGDESFRLCEGTPPK